MLESPKIPGEIEDDEVVAYLSLPLSLSWRIERERKNTFKGKRSTQKREANEEAFIFTHHKGAKNWAAEDPIRLLRQKDRSKKLGKRSDDLGDLPLSPLSPQMEMTKKK